MSYRVRPLALLSSVVVWALLGVALAQGLVIEVASSPPEYVSGGDARLLVHVPETVSLDRVSVWAGTREVTAAFGRAAAGHALEGVVDGLPLGDTTITAFAGPHKAQLTLTNHPITGPMFAGPKQQPFMCATEAHRATVMLGEVLDADCSLATRVDFLYLSDANGLQPYDPAGPRPADMTTVTLADGSEADFVVRWERGTINRFIYSIAMLSPVGRSVEEPDLSGWNRRLVYSFQGGVGIGRYQGGPSRGSMLPLPLLEAGYAVAYSTGTKTGEHYDLILGGETALMVKDRFVTAYGVPDYTVGVGGSGGGIQQYVYAQNHPTLLDAAIPQYAYPDMVTQTIHVGDCELLERWFDAKVAEDPASRWANWEERTLVQGMAAWNDLENAYLGGAPGLSECVNGWRGLSPLALNPRFGTAPGITPEQQATTHWTHFEDAVNVYGRRDDGYARSTWDNVGVQYGLKALVDGALAPEEFLDLNAFVGGWKDQAEMVQEGCPFIEQLCQDPERFDPWSARNMNLSADGVTPAPRTEADPGAIAAVLGSGLYYRGELSIPAIDWRNYRERELDMHNTVQSFATRQRIRDAGYPEENMVIWFTDIVPGEARFDQTMLAFEVIDEWMANLAADPSLSVAAARPARAVDSCFDARGELIYAGADAWAGVLDDGPAGPCAERFRVFSTSRVVAGAPITGDVFKCSLQSVDEAIARGVYGAWQPSAEHVARLKEIFPTGVCDYEQPGVAF